MIGQLYGLARCPHCRVANPRLECVWSSEGPTQRRDGGDRHYWGSFICMTCGSVLCASGYERSDSFEILDIFPEVKTAHGDIPPIARKFLQQAMDTMHAPDAAAVMAGSAVDAMLKEKGYDKGSLYERIDQALNANLLTQGMADWAHSVRLGSNRPRHTDKEKPHTSYDEAKQSVAFAEALGNFLFVLTASIQRGIADAAKAK